MKLVNKSLNKLRLDLELKGLKNRCLLLNNNQSRSEREIQDLSELLDQSPLLNPVQLETHSFQNMRQSDSEE